jgi:hypothetical protein
MVLKSRCIRINASLPEEMWPEIIKASGALKSDSAPPRGSAWETCIAGLTQRRKEVARRERAKSREEGKGGW